MEIEGERRALVEGSRCLALRGLNNGTTGNISSRVGGGFIITPTGIPPEELVPEKLVSMNFDGNFRGPYFPSSDWPMHAQIYLRRPEASAIVHCHSDYCVALSCLRLSIPAFHYMVAKFGGDSVRCAKYASFGSQELAGVVLDALSGRSACLMANHGMVVFGASVADAITKAEALEALARQYCIAISAGVPVLIGDEFQDVLKRYESYGQRSSLR